MKRKMTSFVFRVKMESGVRKIISKISMCRGYVFGLLVFVVTSCALTTETKISSKRDIILKMSIDSIFVVSHLARIGEGLAESFEDAILYQLKKADVRAMARTIDPLAVESDNINYKYDMNVFNPSAILVVTPQGITQDSRRRKITGLEVGVTLLLPSLSKTAPHIIWRAQISVKPAGFFLTHKDCSALARDLVDTLYADGVINHDRAEVSPRDAVSGHL